MYNVVQMIGNAGRGDIPGGNRRLCVCFSQGRGWGVVLMVGAHTLYQVPSMTFLVPVPLRNPRARGKLTATTGFLGTLRRNPVRLRDMVKVEG